MEAPRPHVLVVEDDVELQASLQELFELEGYAVDHAENGAEAIEMLERIKTGGRPCAVLVDLLMPGIVGQELLEYLRDDDELATIPVAIVSGSPQLAPEGYRVFPKPIDISLLVDFVRAQAPS